MSASETQDVNTVTTYDKTLYSYNNVTYDFSDCISDGLPPRAMRYAMENKNNLEKRGSIYVGLGEKRETKIKFAAYNEDVDGSTNYDTINYETAMTGVLNPPEGDGTYVLVLKKGADGVKMAWVSVEDDGTISIPGTFADGITKVTTGTKTSGN